MKTAILSDIHANWEAFEAVLKDIDRKGGVDNYWCLGDVTDYGPDPHKCLERVRQLEALIVLANHDAAVAGCLDYQKEFSTNFIPVTSWTDDHLTVEDKAFLAGLPLKIERGDFTLAHASPRDPIYEYILTREDAEQNLAHFKTSYCLVGHTHISACYSFEPHSQPAGLTGLDAPKRSFKNGRSFAGLKSYPGASIELNEQRLVVNPGAVGKQRDGDRRACYAMFDSAKASIEMRKVEYDLTLTQSKIMESGLPEWLAVDLGKGI